MGAVIRSASIPIEPLDVLESLALKADVVGADLIVAAIRDFANETVAETPQAGSGKTFRSPAAEDLLQMRKKLAARRKSDSNPFRRPAWKLLVKSLLHAVPVALRNRAPSATGQLSGDDASITIWFQTVRITSEIRRLTSWRRSITYCATTAW